MNAIVFLNRGCSMKKKLLYNNLLKRVKPILKTDLGNFIK